MKAVNYFSIQRRISSFSAIFSIIVCFNCYAIDLSLEQNESDNFAMCRMYAVNNYSKAFRYCKKSAEDGNSIAQLIIGNMYHYGNGVKKDDFESLSWYKKAAEQGQNQAVIKLCEMYYYGEGIKKNLKELLKLTRKFAEQGNSTFQYGLGSMYFNGEGVKQDFKEAIKWYKKAAEQGNHEAQSQLAIMFSYLTKGEQEISKKIINEYKKLPKATYSWTLIKVIGFSGENSDQDKSSEGEKQDFSAKKIRGYKKLAELGYSWAQNNLGIIYSYSQDESYNEFFLHYNFGDIGGKDNKNKSKYAITFDLIHHAAEKGYAEAQYNLGDMYYNGLGVKQVYSIALEWYKKAADLGYDNALSELASMYLNGYGVQKNYFYSGMCFAQLLYKQKYEYYEFSPNVFCSDLVELGNKFYSGTEVLQDYFEAIKWYKIAAINGSADAQYKIGYMYLNGQGVRQDKSKATEYFGIACDNKNQKGCDMYKELNQ